MSRRIVLAAVLDVVAVVGFALAGRRSHGSGDAVADVVTVAAPFLIGLGAGWGFTRLWRRPLSWCPAVPMWLATLAIGFPLRGLVWGRGLAVGFLVVATGFTAVTLLGWRLAAAALAQWAPVRSRQRPG